MPIFCRAQRAQEVYARRYVLMPAYVTSSAIFHAGAGVCYAAAARQRQEGVGRVKEGRRKTARAVEAAEDGEAGREGGRER